MQYCVQLFNPPVVKMKIHICDENLLQSTGGWNMAVLLALKIKEHHGWFVLYVQISLEGMNYKERSKKKKKGNKRKNIYIRIF